MTPCAEGLRLKNAWHLWKGSRSHTSYVKRYVIFQTRHAWARWQAHLDGCEVCKEDK